MGLHPEIRVPEGYRRNSLPSKTYAFDFTTGEIRGNVDGREAIRQFIQKAIRTPRYQYLIYPRSYGCEIHSLIGQGYTSAFIESEMIRMITEALIYDERIERVRDFHIEQSDDRIRIAFQVDTTEGTISIEEVMTNG